MQPSNTVHLYWDVCFAQILAKAENKGIMLDSFQKPALKNEECCFDSVLSKK